MLVKTMSRISATLCSIVLLILLSGCTENGSTINVGPNGESSMTFEAPSFLLNARAIVPENLRLFVSINNEVIPMTQQGAIWTGAATIRKNSSVELFVEWREFLPDDGIDLLLARAFKRQPSITSNIIFSVSSQENSYFTTGDGFDFDGDGVSNLEERKQNRNPLVADATTSGVVPDVQIFGSGSATTIDGRIGADAYWKNATYYDVEGEKLAISNMIRDDSPGTEQGSNPDYQWAAIHDGEHLVVFVWGKARNDSTIKINGDSGDELFFHDDSIEIFLDGDLSQLPRDYDAVDDMLINIPLARGLGPAYQENRSSAVNKRIYRGSNVKSEVLFDVMDPDTIEFGTCFCGGEERSTWEVRIDLAAANITVGSTFGFEIQINRDDDGGNRDSKWAWAKPPREPDESNDMADVTWRFPIHMGTARLIPFSE